MKKIISLTLSLLIFCTLGVQITQAQDPGMGSNDPNPPAPPAAPPAPPMPASGKAKIPIPFSPSTETAEQIRQTLSEKEVGSTTIGKNIGSEEGWEQAVPVFDLATAGMRFVISAIFFVAGPLVLIMLVYSGIKLVVMPENEEEQARTKRTLIYSAIGLLVMAFSYAIVQNVIKIF